MLSSCKFLLVTVRQEHKIIWKLWCAFFIICSLQLYNATVEKESLSLKSLLKYITIPLPPPGLNIRNWISLVTGYLLRTYISTRFLLNVDLRIPRILSGYLSRNTSLPHYNIDKSFRKWPLANLRPQSRFI